MPTLSFHASVPVARAIRTAALNRGQKVSRFLRKCTVAAIAAAPKSGLAREFEKLAIDSLALTALHRVKSRAKAAGLDKLDSRQITAVIRQSRRERRRS